MQNNILPTNWLLIFGLVIELAILIASIVAILQREKYRLKLWGRWALINTLGLAIGLLIGGTIVSDINEILGLLVAGCILGVAQWLILRWYLDAPLYWILATTIGLAGGVSIILVRYEFSSLMYLMGIVLGATQLLVIGKQYRGAGWWVAANTIGLAYWVLQIELYQSSIEQFDWRFFAIATISTLVYGAITSLTLIWLLREAIQSKDKTEIHNETFPTNNGISPKNAS